MCSSKKKMDDYFRKTEVVLKNRCENFHNSSIKFIECGIFCEMREMCVFVKMLVLYPI